MGWGDIASTPNDAGAANYQNVPNDWEDPNEPCIARHAMEKPQALAMRDERHADVAPPSDGAALKDAVGTAGGPQVAGDSSRSWGQAVWQGLGRAGHETGEFLEGAVEGAISPFVQAGLQNVDLANFGQWLVRDWVDQKLQFFTGGAASVYARSGRMPDFTPQSRVALPTPYSSIAASIDALQPDASAWEKAAVVAKATPAGVPFAVKDTVQTCIEGKDCAKNVGHLAGMFAVGRGEGFESVGKFDALKPREPEPSSVASARSKGTEGGGTGRRKGQSQREVDSEYNRRQAAQEARLAAKAIPRGKEAALAIREAHELFGEIKRALSQLPDEQLATFFDQIRSNMGDDIGIAYKKLEAAGTEIGNAYVFRTKVRAMLKILQHEDARTYGGVSKADSNVAITLTKQDVLQAEVRAAELDFKTYNDFAEGTPEWQQLKNAYDTAFTRLTAFQERIGWYVWERPTKP